jgi:transaldolase
MSIEYSKLTELSEKFPKTDYWMDSLTGSDIKFGLEHGCSGIVTSPAETGLTLQIELPMWEKRIKEIIKENSSASEKEIFWLWNYEAAIKHINEMKSFSKPNKNNGRLGIQANIYDYNNSERILTQAKKIHSLDSKILVKIPTTKAGLVAMEEAVMAGCSTMGTSCTSVSQMIAAAEALERGLMRREKEGLDCSGVSIGCALQLTIQDILYREYAEKHGLEINPDHYCWGSIAVGKKAYKIFQERGYRARLLTSYYNCIEHITEFIGGDLIMAFHLDWLQKFGSSDVEIKDYIDIPVNEEYVKELSKIPLFVTAYDENGLKPENFQYFAPVRRMQHSFANSYDKGVDIIREIMLPWDCDSLKI